MTLYEFIQQVILSFGKPISYLEIGTQEGGSAKTAFATGMITHATLIDTWGKEYGGTNRGDSKHVITLLGEDAKRATIITGDSRKVLPTLREKFDLVFVDGDHSPEGCLSDMTLSIGLIVPGGKMVVDDLNHPQHPWIAGVVEKFCRERSLACTTHSAHMGVAVIAIPKT